MSTTGSVEPTISTAGSYSPQNNNEQLSFSPHSAGGRSFATSSSVYTSSTGPHGPPFSPLDSAAEAVALGTLRSRSGTSSPPLSPGNHSIGSSVESSTGGLLPPGIVPDGRGREEEESMESPRHVHAMAGGPDMGHSPGDTLGDNSLYDDMGSNPAGSYDLSLAAASSAETESTANSPPALGAAEASGGDGAPSSAARMPPRRDGDGAALATGGASILLAHHRYRQHPKPPAGPEHQHQHQHQHRNDDGMRKHRLANKSEVTMGHVALASLCARTLDSVAGTAHAAQAAKAAAERATAGEGDEMDSQMNVTTEWPDEADGDGEETLVPSTPPRPLRSKSSSRSAPSSPSNTGHSPPARSAIDDRDATPQRRGAGGGRHFRSGSGRWLKGRFRLPKKGKDAPLMSDFDGNDDDEERRKPLRLEMDRAVHILARKTLQEERTKVTSLPDGEGVGSPVNCDDEEEVEARTGGNEGTEVQWEEKATNGTARPAPPAAASKQGPAPATSLCGGDTMTMLEDCVDIIFKADSDESGDHRRPGDDNPLETILANAGADGTANRGVEMADNRNCECTTLAVGSVLPEKGEVDDDALQSALMEELDANSPALDEDESVEDADEDQKALFVASSTSTDMAEIKEDPEGEAEAEAEDLAEARGEPLPSPPRSVGSKFSESAKGVDGADLEEDAVREARMERLDRGREVARPMEPVQHPTAPSQHRPPPPKHSGSPPRPPPSPASTRHSAFGPVKQHRPNYDPPPVSPPGSPQKRRIQMFGSEYARFLSSTPLSPQVVRTGGRRSKLMPKFTKKSGVPHYHHPPTAANNNAQQSQSEALPSGTRSTGLPFNISGSASLAGASRTHSSHPRNVLNIEDASDAVLTGAITDILVTHGSERPPKGYYRISQTGDGDDLRSLKRNVASSGGVSGMVIPGSKKLARVCLNVKKECNWDRAVQRPCVTALAVIYPDRNEFVPPGFCVVRRYKGRSSTGGQTPAGQGSSSGGGKHKHEKDGGGSSGGGGGPGGGETVPANLNFGTAGERVYLCYRRSREGNPVTGIIPLQPSKNEAIPEGYTVLERTPRNYVADVNSKAGPALFLAFRQRLANLEPLRPLPLVLSVYYSNRQAEEEKRAARGDDTSSSNASSSNFSGGTSKTKHRLSAYYCTGGTIVPSEVGRFHIMDRSTHPLLSPSSVSNRLSLIQASRRQRLNGGGPTSPGNSLPGTPGSYGSGGYASSVNSYASSSPGYAAPPNHRRRKGGNNGKSSTSRGRSKGKRTRTGLIFSTSASAPLSDRSSSRAGSDLSLGGGTEVVYSHGSTFGEVDSVVSNSSSDVLGTQHLHQAAQQLAINSSIEVTPRADKHNRPSSPSVSSYSSLHGSIGGDVMRLDARSPAGAFISNNSASGTSASSSLSSTVVPQGHEDDRFRRGHDRPSVFSHDDEALQSCFDAMEFIPPVESARQKQGDNENEILTETLLLQARVAVLTPILTACYTHHGGSALVAVEGLSALLNESDFFEPDTVRSASGSGIGMGGDEFDGSSTRLTLLDLATQVVCDVATSTSRETNFGPCVDFVDDAIRAAKGSLNTRTIGYALRFYLFVFYFGASVPTSSGWPNAKPSSPRGGKWRDNGVDGTGTDEMGDVPLLYEEPRASGAGRSGTYLPGGAPQAAALALKDLIGFILSRLWIMSPVEKREVFQAATGSASISANDDREEAEEEDDKPFQTFVRGVLFAIVDSAVDRVDMANYTQLALHQIHRSGGSELFWHDMMTSCGVGLFGHDKILCAEAQHGYIVSFAIFANLIKVSSGKVRRVAQTSELVPRDVASKLLSLELLLHFLERWRDGKDGLDEGRKGSGALEARKPGEKVEVPSVNIMVYTIRRLLVPGLLSNTGSGMEDCRVFRRMIRIVSELWTTPAYRSRMKVELGILVEHFAVKILKLGPQVLPPWRLVDLSGKGMAKVGSSSLLEEIKNPLLRQQIDVLTEVKRWFGSGDPKDLLEMFLNYDMEDANRSDAHARMMLPGSQWKISQQLCGALCTLAEQCGDIVGEQIRATRTGRDTPTSSSLAAATAPSNAMGVSSYPGTIAYGEDVSEMAFVREGARLLQEKSFEAIAQIMKSLMECAAAASGRKFQRIMVPASSAKHPQPMAEGQNVMDGKDRHDGKTVIAGGFFPISEANSADDDDDDDSNSLGSLSTVGSVSAKPSPRGVVGWKHGFRRNEGSSTPTSIIGGDVPASPRRKHTISPIRPSTPPRGRSSSGDGGIVEYWQTSIAAERKKASLSPGPEQRNKLASETAGQSKGNVSRPPRHRRKGSHGPDGRPLVPPLPSRTEPGGPVKLSVRQSSKGAPAVTSAAKEETSRPNEQKDEETLNVAFEIMTTKCSLKKALEYLLACNFLSPSPRDVASFLRIHQSRIDSVMLGDYLGEGGKDGSDVEYWNLIRFNYVRAISFVGMNVEQGLRHFLTNCGFRLPGEAQRIDRIISTFSQCYWEDNAGDHLRCPFRDQDTVFLISFAIIMLNTDLHKSSSSTMGSTHGSSRKQRKKMTRTEFLNNLRGVDNSEDMSRDYLLTIYDSIEAHPIAIHNSPDEQRHGEGNNNDLNSLIKSLIKSVKPAQELLRGLAVHEHPFLRVSDFGGTAPATRVQRKGDLVPKELVKLAVASTWHHFHGIINAALDMAHIDPKGMEACLDVLKYALCATICLDMDMERSAFVTQLARVKFFKEERNSGGESGISSQDHQAYRTDEWFTSLEKACSDPLNDKAKLSAIQQVGVTFNELHMSLQIDSRLKKDMLRVARRIRNGEILLNDPTRSFLKEGDLVKRCNRSGRNITYRFFLFSDMLVYAHRSSSSTGDYKIHEELPLYLMKIVDSSLVVGNSKKDSHRRSFQIQHPRKSFLAFAATVEDKASWVEDIQSAMKKDVERKAMLEGARLASQNVDR